MADLKKAVQSGAGETTHTGAPSGGEAGEDNRGAKFGTSEQATRGTNRDADRSGTSKNQGHGHPREERGDGS